MPSGSKGKNEGEERKEDRHAPLRLRTDEHRGQRSTWTEWNY